MNSKSPVTKNDVSEKALDVANEQSFPASDPIATSNITRIEKSPEKVDAKNDHQNSGRAIQKK